MRAMKTLLLRGVLPLLVGAAATAAMAYLPIYLVDRGQGARITTIYRGTESWFNARDEAFGLHWSNLQLVDQPLSSPITEGELPAWAEPPPPPHPEGPLVRIGTLASGWPFPVVRARWSIATLDRNFPVGAELDDQDTSIYYAAEDFVKGNRAGGPDEVTILWGGALANFAIFALAVSVLIDLRIRIVTRRATAAAAP
ncbi:MAG: hypothetical protein RLY21_1080 [Planctomycetota bacterium]|jgi:hypothetical protein